VASSICRAPPQVRRHDTVQLAFHTATRLVTRQRHTADQIVRRMMMMTMMMPVMRVGCVMRLAVRCLVRRVVSRGPVGALVLDVCGGAIGPCSAGPGD
jgi:hypothetical protein